MNEASLRFLAVCAIVAFLAWASEQALEPPANAATNLAPPQYAVGEPIAVTVADSIPPVGEATTAPAVTTPQPLNGPATVAVSSARGARMQVTPTEPPPVRVGLHGLPLAPPGLTACETASFYRQQAGLPSRFDGIIWRESNCRPDVRNWCCTGLAQIHKVWVPQLAGCDVFARDDLFDPQRNMCAAAYVYAEQGINAWSTA